MSKLVFIDEYKKIGEAEPFTTSQIMAEKSGNSHRSVKQLIRQYEDRLKRWGRVAFEMSPFETNGGEQKIAVYKLNERQATFLITTMRNTEQVLDFKEELTDQFYKQRDIIMKSVRARDANKFNHKNWQEKLREKYGRSWYEKHFTDLAYRMQYNKSAKQIREQKNLDDHSTVADYLEYNDLDEIDKNKDIIAALLNKGKTFDEIKRMLLDGDDMEEIENDDD